MKLKIMILAIISVSSVLSMEICAEEGLIQSGKRKAYEILNKPKRPAASSSFTTSLVPIGDIIVIKNWSDEPIKGLLYVQPRSEGRQYQDKDGTVYYIPPSRGELTSKSIEIAPGGEFQETVARNIGMPAHIELDEKMGTFNFENDARNKSWQDLKLNGKKVKGVRIWINSVWDEIKK